MPSLKAKAVSGVKWTSLSTAVTAVLQMVQLAVLGRMLSPAAFGEVALVMVVVGVAQTFADGGVSKAIVQRDDPSTDQLSSLFWFSIGLGILVFGILVLGQGIWLRFFPFSGSRSLLAQAAAVFLIVPIGQPFLLLAEKRLAFGRLAGIEVGAAFAGAAVAITTAAVGQGAASIIWGQLASAASRAALCWVCVPPAMGVRFHFRWGDLQGYLGFGLFQMGDRLLNFAAANVDKVLIGGILGEAALGIYSIAFQLMMRPYSVLNPVVTRVAFPVFSAMKDTDRIREGYGKLLEAVALVNFPVYAGLAIASKPILGLLVGVSWVPGAPVLSILSVLGLLRSVSNPIGSVLLAKGRADLGFWQNVLLFGVSVVSVVAGVRWGLTGVASALVLGYLVVNQPLEAALRWYLMRMTPASYLRALSPYLLAASLMAMALLALSQSLQSAPWAQQLPILVVAGGIAYGGAVLVVRKDVVLGYLRDARPRNW